MNTILKPVTATPLTPTGKGRKGQQPEVGLPVEPAKPVTAQLMGGASAQTARTPVQTPVQTPAQTTQSPAQSAPEKTYSHSDLVLYQQQEGDADRAERAAGGNFHRVGSGYTNTPNERTIRLSQPIDGNWYYDPGQKVYAGQSGSEQYFDENGNWKAPYGMEPLPITPGTAAPNGGAPSQRPVSAPATTSSSNDLTSLLEEWKAAAAAQANGQIDYAVAQAITELERALEDAQPAFREQAEAVDLDEAQGLDNSALYAELRGDRGGIGQSQYNEIQAAAAQNRLAVQQAQTRLSTDTARQIADLRAQGEFEKADKLLEITQTYLSQLISLEQWSAEFGFSQEQFRASLDQWQAEYDLALREFEYGVDRNANSDMAAMGEALLSAGVMPNAEQLAAMGMTADQANAYLRQRELEQAAGGGSGGGGGDDYDLTFSQAKSLLESGVYSEKAAAVYEAYAGRPFSFKGNEKVLEQYMDNPAVRTAKAYIDAGRWKDEDLLRAIEAAVDHTITEDEGMALLLYAGW